MCAICDGVKTTALEKVIKKKTVDFSLEYHTFSVYLQRLVSGGLVNLRIRQFSPYINQN